MGDPGLQRLLVGRHRLVDGGERAAHEDGRRYHGTRRALVRDGEVGAHGVDDHLQPDARGLADGMDQTTQRLARVCKRIT